MGMLSLVFRAIGKQPREDAQINAVFLKADVSFLVTSLFSRKNPREMMWATQETRRVLKNVRARLGGGLPALVKIADDDRIRHGCFNHKDDKYTPECRRYVDLVRCIARRELGQKCNRDRRGRTDNTLIL